MRLINVLGRGMAASDFTNVSGDPFEHSLVVVDVAVDAPPPGWLLGDPKLAVMLSSAHATLTDNLLVFVGVNEARYYLDKHDEKSRNVSANEHGYGVASDVKNSVLELPCGQALESNHRQAQRNQKHEAIRSEPDETNSTIDDSSVTLPIMLDGVAQVVDGRHPTHQEHENSSLEAAVCGAWGRYSPRLLDGSL